MEIRIEDELYARSLGWEVLQFLKKDERQLLALHQEVNDDALCVLEKIRCILDDDTLDDPDCFERIERIVKTFYANGIGTSRHDWG